MVVDIGLLEAFLGNFKGIYDIISSEMKSKSLKMKKYYEI